MTDKSKKKIVVYPKCGLLHHFQFQNMLGKSFKLIFNITNSRERKHVLGFKLLLTTAPSHHGFKLHALLSVHLTSKKLSMYNSHIGARKEKKKKEENFLGSHSTSIGRGYSKICTCLSTRILSSQQTKKTLPSFRGNHQNLDAELGPT